jgi:hypothetical protein
VPFFMRFYSSAFPLYWMVYNVINTVFQYRMMKATNPEKSVIKTLVGTRAVVDSGADTSNGTAAVEAVTGAVPARPRQSNAKNGSKSMLRNGIDNAGSNSAGSKSLRPNATASGAAAEDGALAQEDAFEPLNGTPAQNGTAAQNGTHAANGTASNGAANGSLNGARSDEQRLPNRARSSQRARQRRRH